MQCLDTLIAYEIDKDQNSRDEYIEFLKQNKVYLTKLKYGVEK